MVDFSRHLESTATKKPTNPIELYDALDRSSETGPLRPVQLEILKSWYEVHRTKKDAIVKLHTGEGKTLIGLLFLYSKLIEESGRCLYVCPNKYLAKQVMEEAARFGIPFCDFSETSYGLPNEFDSGEKLLITHVQKVFNGKTVFGIGSESVSIDSIVLDDSHACIDSILQSMTVSISRNDSIYKDLISLFSNDLAEQGQGTFFDIKEGEYDSMLPVPYWTIIDNTEQLTEKLAKGKSAGDLKFAWPLIKDSLADSEIFVSGPKIEIRPRLDTFKKFGFFEKAKHRVLMSATTQDDALFIKGLGFSAEAVKNPMTASARRWSGEKMILIPSLIDQRVDQPKVLSLFCGKKGKQKFGIVSIIPSFQKRQQYESFGAEVADTNSIYEKVKSLKDGTFDGLVAFVNRYDGIDLPDASCRILVLDSLPHFDSLADRYEKSVRHTGDLVRTRIAQKIEQGLGRSVRGEKDFSVILLVGDDLVQFVQSPSTRKLFSNQTRKQVEIGFSITRIVAEESQLASERSDDPQPGRVLLELIEQAIKRDEGWKQFYIQNMESIEEDQSSSEIFSILELETSAEDAYSQGDISLCEKSLQTLIDRSDNDVEKAWYLQQLAKFSYKFSVSKSQELQLAAYKRNNQLLKPKEGVFYARMEKPSSAQAKRITSWLLSIDQSLDAQIEVQRHLADLQFGKRAEEFEAALDAIGKALGFTTQRPDKEIKTGPDNLFSSSTGYLLLECKSEVKPDRTEVSKAEASQMNSHIAWFRKEYGDEPCTHILIHPASKRGYQADFSEPVLVLREASLNKLVGRIRSFFGDTPKDRMDRAELELKIEALLATHPLSILDIKRDFCTQIAQLKPRPRNGEN